MYIELNSSWMNFQSVYVAFKSTKWSNGIFRKGRVWVAIEILCCLRFWQQQRQWENGENWSSIWRTILFCCKPFYGEIHMYIKYNIFMLLCSIPFHTYTTICLFLEQCDVGTRTDDCCLFRFSFDCVSFFSYSRCVFFIFWFLFQCFL